MLQQTKENTEIDVSDSEPSFKVIKFIMCSGLYEDDLSMARKIKRE